MKTFLYPAFAIFVYIMNGCASYVKSEKEDDTISTPTNQGLPAQELASGECGIFLWDNSVPRTFIFFHQQGQTFAKYYAQGIENTLQTDQNTSVVAGNNLIFNTYSNAEFETVTLKGTFDEELENGHRISSAIIKIKKVGAWEEIHPVSGAFVCR